MNKGFVIILFFVGILFAEACKNNDNVFPTVLPTSLNVVNASADTLNFYLNGTRQNNTSSLFPVGQSYYVTVKAGQATYQFKKAGGFSVLFGVPLTLTDSSYYSLFVCGATADKSFLTLDQLYTDTVTNSTQIRFVNASPDAGNLDFYAGDTINYKSAPFKGTSAFLATGSGMKEVKVYQSGSASPLVDTLIAFQPGGISTLYSKGLLKGTGTAVFDVGVSINH
ncbi:MAG TPA: DUF4397 domain-containing protein [Mucilaginibacter sp.]|jgi:hypothetical protein|nr:DUF4397 domain-containing protein [Mucilaginibacter sp.]